MARCEVGNGAPKQTSELTTSRSVVSTSNSLGELGHGLALVIASTAVAALASSRIGPISLLVAAVVIGAIIGNTRLVTAKTQPGLAFAAKRILRVGVVLLGLRLSLQDVGALGSSGILVVVCTVAVTFFGTQAIGRRLVLSPALSLLIATGYSICGASAIAAVEGSTDADEEEVAAAIGLVTLFGSFAIFALPLLAVPLGMSSDQFGAWAGASVHDVAQVIATASNYQAPQPEVGIGDAAPAALASVIAMATVVKLTRVTLLAPIVAWVNIQQRRSLVGQNLAASSPPLLPLFVVGFLAMTVLRSTGWLSPESLSIARAVEGWVLAGALVGLGSGVRIARLRRLGPRPLIVGFLAWVLVAGSSFLAIMTVL